MERVPVLTGSQFVIGIDPQINVLAFKTVHLDKKTHKEITLCWFQEVMRRKDSFDKAEEWEKEMIERCDACLRSILQNVDRFMAAYGLEDPPEISLWVEQQRGRCKSIPEAALASIAHVYGMSIHIPHPKTWKKGIDFHSTATGNKANKEASVHLFREELVAYYKENKFPKVPSPDHHLCDAACLARYGCNRILLDMSNF